MTGIGVRRAFAAASAAGMGVAIGHAMAFPHAHWVVWTALTLVAPAADGTLQRTLWRVLGTAGAALGVIAVYGVADPRPEWIVLVMLLAIFVGHLWIPYAKAAYAVLLFLPVGAGFAAMALETPQEAPSIVGYRVFFIVLGSLLAMAFCALLRCQESPHPPAAPPSFADATTHALRVTLASAVCMVLAAIARRPDLAPMMVITTSVLGVLTTVEGAYGKAVLRMGGALAGGIVAVGYYVLLLDITTSIWSLVVVVFAATWLSALLMGVPSFAYLGVQAGYVFAWSIGDTLAPIGDVWVPLERAFQVFVASLVLMLCYRLNVPHSWVEAASRHLRSAAT